MDVLLEPLQRRLTWSPFFRCLGAVGEAEQIHFSTLRFLPTPNPVPYCIFPTFGENGGEETKVHEYNTLVYLEQHLYVHITFVANAVVSRFASSWADTTKRF